MSDDALQTFVLFFFFNDTATTEIYTLSLHDALPISSDCGSLPLSAAYWSISERILNRSSCRTVSRDDLFKMRSEEHTSELQSRQYLVCRLLLEKKKLRAQID